MTTKQCPICGRPLAPMEALLAEHDAAYQCHHCWNRVNAAKPPGRLFGAERKPPAFRRDRRARTHKERY